MKKDFKLEKIVLTFEAHKKQHDNFLKKVTSIDKDYIDENQKSVKGFGLLFIVDWIEGHILKSWYAI